MGVRTLESHHRFAQILTSGGLIRISATVVFIVVHGSSLARGFISNTSGALFTKKNINSTSSRQIFEQIPWKRSFGIPRPQGRFHIGRDILAMRWAYRRRSSFRSPLASCSYNDYGHDHDHRTRGHSHRSLQWRYHWHTKKEEGEWVVFRLFY